VTLVAGAWRMRAARHGRPVRIGPVTRVGTTAARGLRPAVTVSTHDRHERADQRIPVDGAAFSGSGRPAAPRLFVVGGGCGDRLSRIAPVGRNQVTEVGHGVASSL